MREQIYYTMENYIQGHFLLFIFTLFIKQFIPCCKNNTFYFYKITHNRFVYLPNNITHILIKRTYVTKKYLPFYCSFKYLYKYEKKYPKGNLMCKYETDLN